MITFLSKSISLNIANVIVLSIRYSYRNWSAVLLRCALRGKFDRCFLGTNLNSFLLCPGIYLFLNIELFVEKFYFINIAALLSNWTLLRKEKLSSCQPYPEFPIRSDRKLVLKTQSKFCGNQSMVVSIIPSFSSKSHPMLINSFVYIGLLFDRSHS